MNDIKWHVFLERMRLNQAELAAMLNATPAQLSLWVKGKNKPNYDYLKNLYEIGMTPQEMFGLDTEPTGHEGGSTQSIEGEPQFTDAVRRSLVKILGPLLNEGANL